VRPLAEAIVLGFGVLALGCGSDKEFKSQPPFKSEEDVKVWATSASAVGVYSHAHEAFAVADGQTTFADPACPETSDDGTTLTISGGCTDGSDREWTGEATVTRDGDDRTLVLDGFNGNDGTVNRRQTAPSMHEFDADLVIGGVTTITYSGTVEGDYGVPTLWNGSGRVEREGYFSPTGTVEATTADQVVDDDLCSGQPVSGSTTLFAEGDTAVITYDGATDCDPEENAKLSVNGKDRGLIAGINCAVSNPGMGRSGAPCSFLLLSLLVFGLRRARAG
jgi:hypothetical protein